VWGYNNCAIIPATNRCSMKNIGVETPLTLRLTNRGTAFHITRRIGAIL